MKLTTLTALFMIAAALAESPLPVLIWYGPAPTGEIRNDMKNVKNAEFNCLLFIAKEPGVNLQLLTDADDLGLQVYLSDAAIDQFVSDPNSGLRRLDSLTLLYAGYRSFRGFMIYNKPGLKDLPSFAELADFFIGKYPALESFTQLHPLYATPASLDTTNYDAYLDILAQKINPKMLTFEHAAVINNRLRPEFFQNLSAVRRIAQKQIAPFWAYVLLEAVGQPPSTPHSHIRVQVYSGLAFGAKGLQYYAYRPAGNTFLDPSASIVDGEGRLAQTYLNCITVNREVTRLAPVLMSLTSVGVYAGKPAPAGITNLPPNLAVTKINVTDIIIGMFRNSKGDEYVMLVNTDFRTGKRCRVYFAPEVTGLAEVAKDDAPPYRVQLRSPETDDYADLLFKAGDGRLFKILK